jgi:transcriptional regulator with XRE-family HTH domain
MMVEMFLRYGAQEFHTAFVTEVERVGLQDHEVAAALGINRSTVNRWRHGVVAPDPGLRGPVLAWLAGQPTKREL